MEYQKSAVLTTVASLSFLAGLYGVTPTTNLPLSDMDLNTSVGSSSQYGDPFLQLNRTSPNRTVTVYEVYDQVDNSFLGVGDVKSILAKYGLTKSLLANLLGVSRTALYGWLSNPSIMTMDNRANLEKLEASLNVVEEEHAHLLGKMMTYSIPEQRGMTLSKILKKDLIEGTGAFNEAYLSMKSSFNKHAALTNNVNRDSRDYSSAFNQISSAS